MLKLSVGGKQLRVDRRVEAVTTREVEIGDSRGRRWTLPWAELERRAREAPAGWPRATWAALLEEARELRSPGYLARRRGQPPFSFDPVEHQPAEVRVAVLDVVARYEAGDDSVRRTFVGGPCDGQPCASWMAPEPLGCAPDGRSYRHSTTHVPTRRGDLLIYVFLPGRQ